MNIDKQIKQWAQMILEESEDYDKYDTGVTPNTKDGYYATVEDIITALSHSLKEGQKLEDITVEVQYEVGGTPGDVGDWNIRYVTDAKYEKGLLVLYLTDQKNKGLNVLQLLGKVPSNLERKCADIELVDQDGFRFYYVERENHPSSNKLVLFTNYEWDTEKGRNPRVKNGKVNEAEESPITMLFRTRPNVDDNAGKITFTSIDEMKNFIEAVGGDYSKEVADGFTQGKLMSIDLSQAIRQLAIQQQKKS